MKQLVIVGAGGLGRQALTQLVADYAHGTEWLIAGYLDERGPQVLAPDATFPWLGYPASFEPGPQHVFVCAVGNPQSRRAQVEPLLAKGATFVSIRTRCYLDLRTRYGATFFGYDVSAGVDCRIGDYGFIEQQTLLGHDVTLGDYVHISPRCIVAGYVTVGNEVVIHSGALLSRGIRVGDGAVIGMGAVVLRDVPPGATVLGNPARIIATAHDTGRTTAVVA
ncbi:transferase [Pseudomonas fragi]|jgi:sugar O-acyltransferase (sialic acid O-acetyltransferase NeuD family)|uniref:acetyltransferase n=1 Tax=Pseudomonas fragi TaxID=296 RepID=UPI000BA1CC37|nr:acetyltransferase [Pseudomonas fragi]PAA27259.1 transferase [Pseudomonas fragi]